MSSVTAVDGNGDPLEVGDLATVRVKVLGDGGGVGQIRVQILMADGSDVVRTGGEQTDLITNLDATLIDKD